MTTITHEQVVQTLRDLAAERSDHKNPSAPRDYDGTSVGCYYTTPDGDHCIAGETIVRLGGRVPGWNESENTLRLDALIEGDEYSQTDPFDIGIELSEESLALLGGCQSAADRRQTWGFVVFENLPGDVE